MRNVIVTGGSRGIGLAITQQLAAAGYRVIVVARNASEPLAAAIRAAEKSAVGEIAFRSFDLTRVDRIRFLISDLRREFGALYGLVNNAAIGTGGLLGLMRDTDIEALLRLNTLAPILLAKYAARSMMIERAGRIINLSSITASSGYRGLSVYSATKASLVGFTRSLARELGALGITVNAIAPGFVDTDMTEAISEPHKREILRRNALRRAPEASDIARGVEFLMGEGGRNVTGTVLTLDAGATA